MNSKLRQITQLMRFVELQKVVQKLFFQLLDILKPMAATAFVVILLNVTGLMSSVSYLGHWAILQTGLEDASAESTMNEDFDFQFDVKNLEGNKVPFNQFKGKVVFLNIWATWCGPCRAEMASIQKLYSKIDKQKVVFVMLSIDQDGDQRKVIDYLHKKEFTFPAYMPSGYLPSQLQVKLIPTTFIISPEGKIVKKEVGSTQFDTKKFQNFLEELSH